ncbi:hypothetical protein PHET_11682 [Paragonimus heterotremus]|uniref:Uncharacterized protein n=1 Tax=Paragonimus heterotremus TaxID=100268 RepID=A0A8J4SKY6_9TREM|nr:hypothetical protein PHET_11682 [Paragonimus heterotremus]
MPLCGTCSSRVVFLNSCRMRAVNLSLGGVRDAHGSDNCISTVSVRVYITVISL